MIHVVADQVHIGYGSLGVDGALGYKSPMVADRVMLPERIGNYDRCLSAHAPSQVDVEVTEPVSVCGVMNGGCRLHDGGACEFWIDNHWIGDVCNCAEPTPWIHLPPGRYSLRANSTRANWGAHTIWLFRKSDLPVTGRLALFTLGCYPVEHVKTKMKWLHLTAAQKGLYLHVLGVGERRGSWFQEKILRMRKWLADLPGVYSQAVYMDGKDTFVIGDESELVEKLNAFVSPTVIGSENCSMPEEGVEWRQAFVKDTLPLECFPQAGGWGGTIRGVDGLVDVLGQIEALRADWIRGIGPDWLLPYRHFDDDQFLWQAIFRTSRKNIALDTHFKLFANMTCTNTILCDQARAYPVRDRIVHFSGNEPACIHFSGGGVDRMEEWIGFLGLVA
jgi:hypothetical protein